MNTRKCGVLPVWVVALSCLLSLHLPSGGAEASPVPPTMAWTAFYDGPGQGQDQAYDLVVDPAGNVYATGESTGSSVDFATVKYAPHGTLLWASRYDGPGAGTDRAWDLVLDGAGNLLVTGSSAGNSLLRDYATVKYSASGEELWVARYDGPAGGEDYAEEVAVDSQNNVYVTGTSDSSTGKDVATVKYGPDGAQLWAARYGGPLVDWDPNLAVDVEGNVYVGAYSEREENNYDYVVLKYDTDGTLQWTFRYNGEGNGNDFLRDLALDALGNVYVTGASQGVSTSSDITTISLDPGGATRWIARYDGFGSTDDPLWSRSLAVDGAGNAYVCGRSQNGRNVWNFVTVRMGPDGEILWARHREGWGGGEAQANTIVLDGLGGVFVTGHSRTEDCLTVKYDTEGVFQWLRWYDGPDHGRDLAAPLAVDDAGNMYVGGTSWASIGGGPPGLQYLTIKYSPTLAACVDRDQDGYGSPAAALCPEPFWDCDDTDERVHPGAQESCDGRDSNCDFEIPEEEADADGDGWMICAGDCDDTDPEVHPDRPEDCINGIDDDCDGRVDMYDGECQAPCGFSDLVRSAEAASGAAGRTAWSAGMPGALLPWLLPAALAALLRRRARLLR